MTTPAPASSAPIAGGRVTHMIRADIDTPAFFRWAGSRGMVSRNAFDPGFAMHCLLTESFGDAAPKPFRIIIPRDRDRRPGTFYGYTAFDADQLRAAAQTFACPLQSQILPASSIDSKAMPTSWQTGQRLGFEVLIRPVVRRSRGSERAGKEQDAFQHQADPHPETAPRSRGSMQRKREEVYRDWLSERLSDRGACLEDAALRSFQRVRVVRKLRAHASEGPDALMRGAVTVTEPRKFADLVAHGLGRHRAYGYGMLLLRPARTTHLP